jgi:hypothetical protein
VLALRATEAGTAPEQRAVAFAARCRAFLDGPLRRSDGLVADMVDARDRVERTVWSYNQGLAVGVDVLLHRAGAPGALDRARALASRAADYLGTDEQLAAQPPCFMAIWLRMLLLLHSEDGDPRWPGLASAYLDRALGGGPVGAYAREQTLDLAGLVQVAAALALDPDDWSGLC